MLNKVICVPAFLAKRSYLELILKPFLDAEECYSQIVGNALRDVPGPSGKKFIEAYMMSRVRNECVFTVFLRLRQDTLNGANRSIQIEM
jgi:hypothetical protein